MIALFILIKEAGRLYADPFLKDVKSVTFGLLITSAKTSSMFVLSAELFEDGTTVSDVAIDDVAPSGGGVGRGGTDAGEDGGGTLCRL